MSTNPKCRAAGGSCNCSNSDAVSCPDQYPAPGADLATDERALFDVWWATQAIKPEYSEFQAWKGWFARARTSLAAVPASEPVVALTKALCQAQGKYFELLHERAAAPAPVSGMPDLASLQRYDWTEKYIGAVIEFLPNDQGGYVKLADVERLLNPAKGQAGAQQRTEPPTK